MTAKKAPSTKVVDAKISTILDSFKKNELWDKVYFNSKKNCVLRVHLGPKNDYQSTDEEGRGITGSGTDYLTPMTILRQLNENLQYDKKSLFKLKLIQLNCPGMEYKTIVTSLDKYLEFTVKGLELIAEELEKRKARLDEKPKAQDKKAATITLPANSSVRSFRNAVNQKQKQLEGIKEQAAFEKRKAFGEDLELAKFYYNNLSTAFWDDLREARNNGQTVKNVDTAEQSFKSVSQSGIHFIDAVTRQQEVTLKHSNYDISQLVDSLLARIEAANAKIEEASKVKAIVVWSRS